MSHTVALGDCVTSSHRGRHCSLISQAHVLLLKKRSLNVAQSAAENSPREILFYTAESATFGKNNSAQLFWKRIVCLKKVQQNILACF